MTMHRIALVVACSVCSCYGWGTEAHQPSQDFNGAAPRSHLLQKGNELNARVGVSVDSKLHRLKALALFLLASHPVRIPPGARMASKDGYHNGALAAGDPVVSMSGATLYKASEDVDSISDPYARQEERERKAKEDDIKLNWGKAVDTLNKDIPQILQVEPNWDIYAEDMELDLTLVDPAAVKLLGAAVPASRTKIHGLKENKRAWQHLHAFRERLILWDQIKVRTRESRDVETGDKIIVSRWNARLAMKPVSMPKWAAVAAGAAAVAGAVHGSLVAADFDAIDSIAALGADEAIIAEVAAAATAAGAVKVLQERFPDLAPHFATAMTYDSHSSNALIVDANSRFHLNSEGKIYRHVIDNVDIKLNNEPVLLHNVEGMLRMAGGVLARQPVPAAAG